VALERALLTGFNRKKVFGGGKRLESREGYRTDSPYKSSLGGILEYRL